MLISVFLVCSSLILRHSCLKIETVNKDFTIRLSILQKTVLIMWWTIRKISCSKINMVIMFLSWKHHVYWAICRCLTKCVSLKQKQSWKLLIGLIQYLWLECSETKTFKFHATTKFKLSLLLRMIKLLINPFFLWRKINLTVSVVINAPK